jgi:hypothetical protein
MNLVRLILCWQKESDEEWYQNSKVLTIDFLDFRSSLLHLVCERRQSPKFSFDNVLFLLLDADADDGGKCILHVLWFL